MYVFYYAKGFLPLVLAAYIRQICADIISFCCLQRVNLSFDFPFYGHMLREVTVTTGGQS